MKNISVLLFLFPCVSYTMLSPLNTVWIKTKDKKVISLTYEEACQSFYISECNRLSPHISSKKNPLQYDEIYHKTECFELKQKITLDIIDLVKSKKINITAQEINFFKKIIHRPSLYDKLKPKKYIKALTIAEKFKAPFLYAELLQGQLPHQALTLITEKYKTLSRITNNLDIHISHTLFARWKEKKYSAEQRGQHMAKAQGRIQTLLENLSLSDLVLLDILSNKNCFGDYFIRIVPHMPGFKELEKWRKDTAYSILNDFPVNIVMFAKKESMVYSFTFKV